MAKRGRKRGSERKASASPETLRQNGLRSFRRGDYAGAIVNWEILVRDDPTRLPASALAEVYFRRALKGFYGGSRDAASSLSDLRRATQLVPDDACYRYHFALVAHHAGELDSAIAAYRQVRHRKGPFAERAAYPLALALLQRGDDPSTDVIWRALSEAQRKALDQAQAFRRRPYDPPADAPLLWRGLAALDGGDRRKAEATLQEVLRAPASLLEESMAHYYLGVLAAQAEQWEEAGLHWSTAHVGGLASPWLVSNLGELYHRLAEDRLQEGEAKDALAAANEAGRHKGEDRRLDELFSQAYQRLAHQAVSAGQWPAALDYWEKATEVGGSSFRLAYNRALAYENEEAFIDAGDAWREALRRRPRSADHPDAITDEQVARLWRRAAEAYQKAGEYEEAANVYRQAIKWDPDNIETRMALADGLMNDGRLEAAENELGRILERDPDHIPALLLMGEAVDESGHWWYHDAPTHYWERVLELDPANASARQLLVDFYEGRGDDAAQWGNLHFAIQMYEQALRYEPLNGRILAALGSCHFRAENPDAGRAYIQTALEHASQDLETYDAIIQAWLELGDAKQAWQVMGQAEAAVGTIPFEFYIHEAAHCIGARRGELADPWLARAVEKAPPGQPVFLMIGEMAVMMDSPEIGRKYLQQAIKSGQHLGQVYLMLGILSAKEGALNKADEHWQKATEIAQQTRDTELSQRIMLARGVFGDQSGLMQWLMRNPSLMENLDFFDDEDDEDDFFFEP